MTEAHRTILRKNHCQLYEDLDLDELIEHLYQNKVILALDKERLQAKKTRTHKAIELLHILPDKRDECFILFVNALCKTHQCHLANILVTNFCTGHH